MKNVVSGYIERWKKAEGRVPNGLPYTQYLYDAPYIVAAIFAHLEKNKMPLTGENMRKGLLAVKTFELPMTGKLVFNDDHTVKKPVNLLTVKDGQFVPLAVAAYILAWGTMGGLFDGAAMNPARALGPDVALGDVSTWWVYLVGPVIGAVLLSVLFFREKTKPLGYLGILLGLSGIVLLGPRVYFAMAGSSRRLRWLHAVHPRFRTPHRAIAVQAVWASALVATGTYRALFTRVRVTSAT